jgi:altronate dehydratase small subunit
MSRLKDAILINSKDNVATCLKDFQTGEIIHFDADNSHIDIEARETIESGHKVAVKPIKKGQAVIKYGEIIGLASKHIKKGDHVHVHNVAGRRGRGDLQ